MPDIYLLAMSFCVALSVSALIGWLLVHFEDWHAHLSHDHLDVGPQKFHARPTPRIGGIAVFFGLVSACIFSILFGFHEYRSLLFLLVAGLPAFLSGLQEDLTKTVRPLIRLSFTMAAGAVGYLLLNAALIRVDIIPFDYLLAFWPISLIMTMVAVGGIANAVNIIDGYNGLASGFVMIASIGLAIIGWQVDDRFISLTAIAIAGATAGFWLWNYPHGRIFLGDGGAYFLGFLLAELTLLLIVRHAEISPWCPMLLLIYPVFETLFSIYRRRAGNANTVNPDAMHLHQLIYRRLVRQYRFAQHPDLKTRRNAAVAPYLWLASTTLSIIPATLFWRHESILMIFCVLFCLTYVWLYRRIVRFTVPKWLIRF